MKFKTVLITWIAAEICVIANPARGQDDDSTEGFQSSPRINKTTELASNFTSEEEKPHLRLISKLKNRSLTSGEKVQLRCRADAWPQNQMQFTWYKDSQVIVEDNEDNRITIRNRGTTTKLTIKSLLTSDSGSYRCEVSNGFFGAHSSAVLKVGFSLPPTDDPLTISAYIPKGKCETYQGKACDSILKGKNVYVDPFYSQAQMEEQISYALSYINNLKDLSANCRHFAHPSLCNFVFSPCEEKVRSKSRKTKAYPIKLCREDCELMKYDVCAKEYKLSENDGFLKSIFETADCSSLPAITSHKKCTKAGLPSVVVTSHTCYNDTGIKYKGTAGISERGNLCETWPRDMVQNHPELSGGHHYCRNPGGEMSKPWCYVKDHVKEVCQLQQCEIENSDNGISFMIIVIPSVLIPLIACFFLFLFCACRRHQTNEKNNKNKKENIPNKTTATLKKMNIPELQSNSLSYVMKFGESQFGKVYKALILPNPYITTSTPVIVKALQNNSQLQQIEQFKKELEVFAELQNKNVASLKAFVLQPNLHAMVFEFTGGTDLHEFLIKHSPHCDYEAPTRDGINQQDFIQMAIQTASGMKFLTNNNFIHRDLAARNILVCGNMELKISNLGVVRDSYLSSYYRSPQGGQMLPIRWMAPESIYSWTFSDKTTVWSFGVLLWEMFSYGSQPYCGYSNQEVLEMISHGQLLNCPDQCPAKMYSLMQECWSSQPQQRPDFKELLQKLQAWVASNTMRITSQLAKGVSRQLEDVRNDGVTTFVMGSSVHSADRSSSANTYNSGSNFGHLPPEYSSSYQPTSSSLYSPQTSDWKQNFVPRRPDTSQFAKDPYRDEQDSPTVVAQENYQERNQLSYFQRDQGPGSQSGRSTSSHFSEKEKLRVSTPSHLLKNNDKDLHPHKDASNEIGNNTTPISHYQDPRSVRYQSPSLNATLPSGSSEKTNQQRTQPRKNNQADVDSSDISSNSFKATSCDSGLPVEDVDHSLECSAPLLKQSQPVDT